MTDVALYPLRFDPIFQYRLWGGRRLEQWFDMKLPVDGPIGEAWLLSDRDDFPSLVADGPLKGQTIPQLIERSPDLLLGELSSTQEVSSITQTSGRAKDALRTGPSD